MPHKVQVSTFLEIELLEEIRLLKRWYEQLTREETKMSPFLARLIKFGIPEMRKFLEELESKT